jgi:diguanylate cyclase (GGDEF)-like protein/PAS domain S-box-containing protein
MRRRDASSATGRILIAAPDGGFRRDLRELLERLGLSAVAAEDSSRALRVAERWPPDLVIVDARGGPAEVAWLESALAERPVLAETPLLAVVPSGRADAAVQAVEAGATDVVRVPFHPGVLERRVRSLLEASQSRSELFRCRERLESIQRIARIATWSADPEAGDFHGAREFRPLLGLDPAPGPVSRKLLLSRIHPEDREMLETRLSKSTEGGEAFSLDTRIQHADGSERIVHWQGVATPESDEGGQIAGVLQDVTERKRAEEQIRLLSHCDGLTGLSNRRAFLQRFAGALDLARRHERSLALLVLNLDNFKRVNETHGHALGDRVLQGVAERLDRCLRQTDLVVQTETSVDGHDVSRLGADEYTVLLSEIAQPQDAARVAGRILASLREPFDLAGHEVIVGASIGISVYPDDGDDVDDLLHKADVAMCQAKSEGRNDYQFFTARMDADSSRRLDLEERLCRAFENHELQVYYQPQVDMESGTVIGVEALLRWSDPEYGAVSPAEFVPLAEDAGIIKPIGEWVLRTACWQAKAWREDGVPPLRLAVNISPHHFGDDRLVETVNQVLWDTGLEASQLELEITENVLMGDEEDVVAILKQLKRIGVSISLDDFGTGYSSLSYLKRFPVDSVKIDRSFVRDIPLDPDDEAITAAIISMAKALRLRVVAEGVETEQQREFLSARGCDEVQGYLFSPPVAPPVVAELVRHVRFR